MLFLQAAELEVGTKKLKDRLAGLLAGAKKYRDGVSAMYDAQVAFAAALQEFGGGTDEDSLLMGEVFVSLQGAAGGSKHR
jgi:hypothetical protein